MDDKPDISHIELERIKYAALMYISKELASEFAIPPQVDVSNMLDFMCSDLVLRVRQDILGKTLDRVEIRYPADWWQAFRQRWLPKWILKHYPVIETIKIIDVKALYPKLNIPGHKPIINVWQQESSSWYKHLDNDDD